MTEDTALFLVAGFFATACLAAMVLVYWRRQKMLEYAVRRREQTLVRFSERFGTAAEFQEFAGSPEAQRCSRRSTFGRGREGLLSMVRSRSCCSLWAREC